MTQKWDSQKYVQLVKKLGNYNLYESLMEDDPEKMVDLRELFFYNSCITAAIEYKDCQRYSTILHSFLAHEIDIERLRDKFLSFHIPKSRLASETVEKIEESIRDNKLTAEELDLQIHWEPEFQILSEKIDLIYQILDEELFYFSYERWEYANEFSVRIYLCLIIRKHIRIFKKLS
uniref:hypothetical protein n=1 Tax=Pseudo-nitzschia cuspidata TaxID=237455 RepID=UPI001D0FD59D|nr:hypothetical protein KQ377_pgp114 [Pseudo-nitzschia cuspidata]UBA15401.1 hypothetical protein [Pseudo-nitzschia cuspidata]